MACFFYLYPMEVTEAMEAVTVPQDEVKTHVHHWLVARRGNTKGLKADPPFLCGLSGLFFLFRLMFVSEGEF